MIRALLLCRRHVPLALWLLGTLLYGAVAGALLREHPPIAGAVLATIWVAAIWRGSGSRRSGAARGSPEELAPRREYLF